MAGIIAGRMTKSNVIGYIGSFPIPEVVRGINAFTLALRRVNPKATVKVVWVSTWYDPRKEAEAAKVLMDQGADVILQHTDSTAPIQAAQDAGKWAAGQASDMTQFAPRSHLTAIIDNWNSYYVNRVKAAMDGTWTSQDTWSGLKERMVEMAAFNDAIPDEVKKEAKAAHDAIIAGTQHPFQGPFSKQDGTPAAKDGETLDDGTLLGMNWYVEGVEGQLPK